MSGEDKITVIGQNYVQLTSANGTASMIHFHPDALETIGYSLQEAVDASEINKYGIKGFLTFLESLPAGGLRIIKNEDSMLHVIVDERPEFQSLDKMVFRERPDENIPIIDKEAIPAKLRTRRRRDTSSIMLLREFFEPEDEEYTSESDRKY